MQLFQNLSIHEGATALIQFSFSKISNSDLDLNMTNLIQGIVVLNICVKLYQNL